MKFRRLRNTLMSSLMTILLLVPQINANALIPYTEHVLTDIDFRTPFRGQWTPLPSSKTINISAPSCPTDKQVSITIPYTKPTGTSTESGDGIELGKTGGYVFYLSGYGSYVPSQSPLAIRFGSEGVPVGRVDSDISGTYSLSQGGGNISFNLMLQNLTYNANGIATVTVTFNYAFNYWQYGSLGDAWVGDIGLAKHGNTSGAVNITLKIGKVTSSGTKVTPTTKVAGVSTPLGTMVPSSTPTATELVTNPPAYSWATPFTISNGKQVVEKYGRIGTGRPTDTNAFDVESGVPTSERLWVEGGGTAGWYDAMGEFIFYRTGLDQTVTPATANSGIGKKTSGPMDALSKTKWVRQVNFCVHTNDSWGANNPCGLTCPGHAVASGGTSFTVSLSGSKSAPGDVELTVPSKQQTCSKCGEVVVAECSGHSAHAEKEVQKGTDKDGNPIMETVPDTASVSCSCSKSHDCTWSANWSCMNDRITLSKAGDSKASDSPVSAPSATNQSHNLVGGNVTNGNETVSFSTVTIGEVCEGYTTGWGCVHVKNTNCVHHESLSQFYILEENIAAVYTTRMYCYWLGIYDTIYAGTRYDYLMTDKYIECAPELRDAVINPSDGWYYGSTGGKQLAMVQCVIDDDSYVFTNGKQYGITDITGQTITNNSATLFYTVFPNAKYKTGSGWISTGITHDYMFGDCNVVMYLHADDTPTMQNTALGIHDYPSSSDKAGDGASEYKTVSSTSTTFKGHTGSPMTQAQFNIQAAQAVNAWQSKNNVNYTVIQVSDMAIYGYPDVDAYDQQMAYCVPVDAGIQLFNEPFTPSATTHYRTHYNQYTPDQYMQGFDNIGICAQYNYSTNKTGTTPLRIGYQGTGTKDDNPTFVSGGYTTYANSLMGQLLSGTVTIGGLNWGASYSIDETQMFNKELDYKWLDAAEGDADNEKAGVVHRGIASKFVSMVDYTVDEYYQGLNTDSYYGYGYWLYGSGRFNTHGFNEQFDRLVFSLKGNMLKYPGTNRYILCEGISLTDACPNGAYSGLLTCIAETDGQRLENYVLEYGCATSTEVKQYMKDCYDWWFNGSTMTDMEPSWQIRLCNFYDGYQNGKGGQNEILIVYDPVGTTYSGVIGLNDLTIISGDDKYDSKDYRVGVPTDPKDKTSYGLITDKFYLLYVDGAQLNWQSTYPYATSPNDTPYGTAGISKIYPNVKDARTAGAYGYTNYMNTERFTASRWVRFPFAVSYTNTDGKKIVTAPNTWIRYDNLFSVDVDFTTGVFAETTSKTMKKDLSAYQSVRGLTYGKIAEFTIYISALEAQNAKVEFFSRAVNDATPFAPPPASFAYNKQNHLRGSNHDADHFAGTYEYMDVVGTIGNFAIEDSTDYRFGDTFKQELYYDDYIPHVDNTKSKFILTTGFDILGNDNRTFAGNTSAYQYFNTFGITTITDGVKYYGKSGPFLLLPLSQRNRLNTYYNGQETKLGYQFLGDIETIGSYHGYNLCVSPTNYATSLTDARSNYVTVENKYVLIDPDTNEVFTNIYAYLSDGSNVRNIYPYNSAAAEFTTEPATELDRRNISQIEKTLTENVTTFTGRPSILTSGVHYVGSYSQMKLDSRDVTYIGSPGNYGKWANSGTVYSTSTAFNVPSNISLDASAYTGTGMNIIDAAKNCQRYHFTLGLPSGVQITLTEVSDSIGLNTKVAELQQAHPNAVVVMFTDIYSIGDVWTLHYRNLGDKIIDLTKGDGTVNHFDTSTIPGDHYDRYIPTAIYTPYDSSASDLSVIGIH